MKKFNELLAEHSKKAAELLALALAAKTEKERKAYMDKFDALIRENEKLKGLI